MGGYYGSHPRGEPLQSAADGPRVCLPGAPRGGPAYKCQHGGVPPKLQLRDFLQRPSLGEHFCPGEGPPRAGRGTLPCIYDQPTHEMPLAASIGEADHASNCMGMWARRLLGQENPSPPAQGAPPKATSGTTTSTSPPEPTAPAAEPAPEEADEDEDSDVELTAEERAEVARIEEECSALERRMRDLSAIPPRKPRQRLQCCHRRPPGGHGEAHRPAEGKGSERWRTAEGEGEPSLCK